MKGLMLGRKAPSQAHASYNDNIAQGIVNEAMVNVVKAIDAGELESGFENVELVLSSAGH